MRKSMKEFFSFFLAISICFLFSVTAFAQLLYINEPEMNNYLSISGGKATMYSSVTADSSVTKIVITHVLLYPDNSPLNNTITGLTLSAIREIEDF